LSENILKDFGKVDKVAKKIVKGIKENQEKERRVINNG